MAAATTTTKRRGKSFWENKKKLRNWSLSRKSKLRWKVTLDLMKLWTVTHCFDVWIPLQNFKVCIDILTSFFILSGEFSCAIRCYGSMVMWCPLSFLWCHKSIKKHSTGFGNVFSVWLKVIIIIRRRRTKIFGDSLKSVEEKYNYLRNPSKWKKKKKKWVIKMNLGWFHL